MHSPALEANSSVSKRRTTIYEDDIEATNETEEDGSSLCFVAYTTILG